MPAVANKSQVKLYYLFVTYTKKSIKLGMTRCRYIRASVNGHTYTPTQIGGHDTSFIIVTHHCFHVMIILLKDRMSWFCR